MDFDSAIPRFESWRPSQPAESLPRVFQVWENRRHSRGLAGNGRVFGEENRALPTEGGVFLDESLLHEFSISGIGRWCDQRPVAFWQRRVRRSPGSTSASSRPVLLALLQARFERSLRR